MSIDTRPTNESAAEELAFLLSQLDTGSVTVADLTHFRSVIRKAVQDLRTTEVRISAAKTDAEERVNRATKSLRDELAMSAMNGRLAASTKYEIEHDVPMVAEWAYRTARIMMSERDKDAEKNWGRR